VKNDTETQPIHIVTDSSCDLPRRLIERLRIVIVPLLVHFSDETYLDGELSADEFWKMAGGPEPPKTSQPSVGAFEEVFQHIISEGKRVLCVTLTGKHSGTFNAARVAAERFGGAVEVFDSWSISVGLGVQVLAADRAAKAGKTMQEIVSMLEELRSRVQMTVLLDTLQNVRRGGRADGFIPVLDKMTQVLNIKALIEFVEGSLKLRGAVRSFKRGLRRMVDEVADLGTLDYLAVMHTRCQEMAEDVADRLAEKTGFPRERIWVEETGPALATHAGPGAIGIVAVPIRDATT